MNIKLQFLDSVCLCGAEENVKRRDVGGRVELSWDQNTYFEVKSHSIKSLRGKQGSGI